MTVMTLFWLLAAALTAVTMAVLLTPLLRRARTHQLDTRVQGPTARSQMVRWYHDQLRELDADLRAGTIDAAGHAHARAELGRRLLDDTADTADSATTPPARPDRRLHLFRADRGLRTVKRADGQISQRQQLVEIGEGRRMGAAMLRRPGLGPLG